MRAIIDLPDLTIASGAQVSDALTEDELEHLDSIAIFSPAALDGTITVEVADVRNPSSSDWRTLQSGGSDVTVAVDSATTINELPFRALRLASSVSETAERVFDVNGQEAA